MIHKIFPRLCLCSLAIVLLHNADAAQRIWNNTSTNFNSPGSWLGGDVTGNVADFTTPAVMQPNVSANISVVSLYFNGVSGYDVTSSSGATLTLTAQAAVPIGETSNLDSTAIAATNTSGTNTIDAALQLSSSGGISSTVSQAAGGTLVLNGAISASQNASFTGGGTIQINNANTFITSSIDGAGTTIVVGNNNAFGAGPLAINAATTFQSSGGTHFLSNSTTIGADVTISGSNGFSFAGQNTISGDNRTLTVSNTAGGASFQGNLYLQEAGASGHTFTIAGSSNFIIFANVHDGGVGPATLRYSGTGVLQILNPNDYTGGTIFSGAGATIYASTESAFGTGNVSLTAGNITLNLGGASTGNNYIADGAVFSIALTDTVNLNYNGTDIVKSLVINGVALAPGVYDSSNVSEFFGPGSITVIPEPATWLMLSLGGILLFAARAKRLRTS